MIEAKTDIRSVSFSSVAIIGGGMGGLFTGALLAKFGYEVHVYEKNQIIGGGLQSFRREGVYFNPGMHNFGGFGEGWALSHMLRFLGIKEQLRVMPVDEDAQEIVWTDATHCYRLPRGRERFEAYLGALFPNQAAGLHRYLDTLYEVAESFDNFYLRPRALHPETEKYVNMKLLSLLRLFIDDEELIRLLSFLSPLCGNVPSEIPVPLYAMLSVLYLAGEYRFIDNSLQLADALRMVIEAHGGEVVSSVEISEIKVQNAHVVAITDTKGRQYRADAYVGAITPKILYAMTTEEVARRVTIKRAENFETNKSVFSVYVKFRPESFPFINSSIYIPIEDGDPNKPPYIIITTPPVSYQGPYAETMEILVPIFYESFAAWNNTTLHHRGEDYERTKKAMAKDIIEYVSSYYDIRSAIQNVYTATPLTVRDYYNNPGGAVFSQMGLNVPFMTRTDNMFVTGQSVLFHGLCGVPLTAILTAEAVSGQEIMTAIRNIG